MTDEQLGTGTITIQLVDGRQFTGRFSLTENRSEAGGPPLSSSEPAIVMVTEDLDFSVPIRPFMNDHADGLNGAKKFALLVAHFAKGEVDVPVDRAEVVEAWNKMTGLLGGKFNGAHESRAKDAGYLYVPASGSIALLKKWRQALL